MDEGATRAADGSIDRVPDPPESLRPFLLSLKKMAKAHGIGKTSHFRAALLTREWLHRGCLVLLLRAARSAICRARTHTLRAPHLRAPTHAATTCRGTPGMRIRI